MLKKKTTNVQKKVSKTKRGLKSKTGKKTAMKTSKKTAMETAKKTKAAKDMKIPKKTKAASKKTESLKKVTKTKKTAVPQMKTKRKLSPREKLMQEIKKKLIEQRNTLLSEAEEALNMLPGQTIFPDMGDQASAEIDRSFMLRLRGREQRLLKKIEASIEKIDNGSFGTCEVCGEEIHIKRLEARPVTTMCIFCKKEQEEEEKLRGE